MKQKLFDKAPLHHHSLMHLIAHLEGYLISIWHLGVGQDRHHPLLVVDRLRRRHRERQSLMFQKIAAKFLFGLHLLQHFKKAVTLCACSNQ